jgi:ABC-type proline/glycine betaine transport system ATPase subunit
MLFIGISASKAEEEARKLLERLNLTAYADRYPFELSGGQQQRVGIARALANDPPIIIADEPLGNLDSVNAQTVLEFFKELNEKDGRTIIMVTHEAWSLRDTKTIFHMKDGEVISVEKTKQETIAESLSKHLYEQLHASGKASTDNKEERVSDRMLANFLLRGYSMEEISRFESFVNDRFDGKIDKKEFDKLIYKPFSEGGMGFSKKKAERVINYLETVIEKRKNVSDVLEVIEKNPEISIQDEIISIRKWVLEGYTGELSPLQIAALDQVISDRIRCSLPAEKVAGVLNLGNNKFGVGLSFRAAELMAEKLELVLNSDLVKTSNGENVLNKL